MVCVLLVCVQSSNLSAFSSHPINPTSHFTKKTQRKEKRKTKEIVKIAALPKTKQSLSLSHQKIKPCSSSSLSTQTSVETDPTMENSSKPQERENPSPLTSPTTNSSNSSSSSSSNGVQPSLTPKPILRSETTPYPTTFIQADSSSFKQVVQILTGSPETAKHASKATVADQSSKSVIPPIRTGPKKQGFKLYERRNSLKNLKLSPLVPGLVQGSGFSPRNPEILSPSILDFPSLVLSPVTPLILDPFNRSPHPCTNNSTGNSYVEEEKAIAEKGFYLHPSPITTPRDSEPRLLPLFPVSSPRVSGSSS